MANQSTWRRRAPAIGRRCWPRPSPASRPTWPSRRSSTRSEAPAMKKAPGCPGAFPFGNFRSLKLPALCRLAGLQTTLLHQAFDDFPIHQLVQEVVEVVRADIAEVQVI